MLAVVCHDAGGAENISSYVREHSLDCCYVLDGPALKIFQRKLGAIKISPLDEAIQQSTSILCGTSWQSDIELNAIRLARSLGKRSVAFLDHWVNYLERFTRSGEVILPDEILVGDPIAQAMATEIFISTPVRLVENCYFQDIRRELAAITTQRPPIPDRISVLYVCEPIREYSLRQFGDERHCGYVEEDAIRFSLANLAVFDKPLERILIRPHPSEPSDKYNWVESEFNLPIAIGGSHTLLEEIVDCDVVVGCESMAMVVGLIAGKRVISCIPPGGKACALPHPEIEHLQTLLQSS